MLLDTRLLEGARAALKACEKAGVMLATVESCTGGLIAASLTEIDGSSKVLEAGFVTYSNRAKTKLVGVPAALIAAHGAVSREVAIAMAEGALTNSSAGIAVSVTGIAGPGGGTKEKPVGMVHMACARKDVQSRHKEQAYGPLPRHEIRIYSVIDALKLVQECLAETP